MLCSNFNFKFFDNFLSAHRSLKVPSPNGFVASLLISRMSSTNRLTDCQEFEAEPCVTIELLSKWIPAGVSMSDVV